jgi:hypothetical protein
MVKVSVNINKKFPSTRFALERGVGRTEKWKIQLRILKDP